MGRKKIPIKKLEVASQRRCTFKKRSEGIQNKAKELSIICDEQVLLLFREPKGQYHLCLGENSTFDGVVKKFLSDSQENHEKLRQDSIKMLKKSYKGDSHALNSLSLMDHGMIPADKKQGSEEMDLEHIQEEISKIESQMGPLRNMVDIDKLECFDELTAMENSVMLLLAANEKEMVQLVEQQKSGCPDSMITLNERDNLQCFNTSTSVPATNYQIDQQVATMLNPTPHSYQRDNLQCFTSTSVPATNYQMDKQVATMVNPTPPSQRESLQYFTSTSVPTTNYHMDQQVAMMINPTPPYPRDNLQCFPSTSFPATNYLMDQQIVTMLNPTPPYQRDSLQCFTSTSVPATNYQMDQQVVTMLNLTPPYQSDSMASTSTAPPMLTYPSMAGMYHQARLHR